jgi:succinylglutamic semialdehyde dehydrogenase
VVSLLLGARGPAEALVAHVSVDGVLFTGGVPAGRAIHRAGWGGRRRSWRWAGGNNPLVVDAAISTRRRG